jgi:predicted double-glycine peptidase
MVLAYLGIVRSQADLARVFQVRSGFGAPARNILNLRSRQIEVTYQTNGTWEDIRLWLQRQLPVIACVQAGELPHWQGIQAQHAVVVVGLDEDTVHLHDPALDHGPVAVPTGDFWLAWDEMEDRYAVLTKRQ